MGYIVWDTERIRNTKIYMLAYILLADEFNIIKNEIIIDSSIDVSKRTQPRLKVERLKNESLVLSNFNEVASLMIPLLNSNKSICFGKEDFISLNDQLKLNNLAPLEGKYYDIELFIHDNNINMPSNLGAAAKFLKLEHDAHNPLSDSFVTLEYFKCIIKKYPSEMLLRPIPNKDKVLDIIENGSYELNKKK